MGDDLNVYCPTCFAMPREMCRTRYLVHGDGEVTPVICRTHIGRVLNSQKDSIRNSIARQLLAAALMSLRGR
jgi:hypothetical protein